MGRKKSLNKLQITRSSLSKQLKTRRIIPTEPTICLRSEATCPRSDEIKFASWSFEAAICQIKA